MLSVLKLTNTFNIGGAEFEVAEFQGHLYLLIKFKSE